MPTTREIREILNLPRNMKSRQVLNRAIRLCAPGGNELLDTLERLDFARIQFDNDPSFAAEVGKLRERRDQLADDLRAGRIPLQKRSSE